MKLKHILLFAIMFIASSCTRPPNEIPFPTQPTSANTQTIAPVLATNTPKLKTAKPSYHGKFWEPLISENHGWTKE